MAGPLGGIGPLELAIIAGIALVIFGPKNLPKLGKSVGKTVKSVREGMEGKFDEDEDAAGSAPAAQAPVAPVAPAPAPAPEAPAPTAAPAPAPTPEPAPTSEAAPAPEEKAE